MEKMRVLYTLRDYTEMLRNNPRVTNTEVHRKISPYNSQNSTSQLLKESFAEKKVVGPYLFCNSGFSFQIKKLRGNSLKILRSLERKPQSDVTHAIALSGRSSLLVFRKNGNDLKFTDSIVPTLPAKLKAEEFQIEEIKGKLKEDKYPESWNEMDWKVFYEMRAPRASYGKIAGRLKVEWITVRRHYHKILADCKVLTAFFPKGYNGYSRLLAVFKTKFEVGLIESLKKLDRSSYVWKCKDFILLTLFVDNYNLASERLELLEENGLIRNLSVSIPIRYYVKEILDFPKLD